MTDVTHYFLGDVLEHWRPGSHDWSWAEEAADLIQRDGADLAALVLSMHRDSFRKPLPDEEPVMLGDDGRVWSGHHRIIAAVLAQRGSIFVAFGGEG